MIVSRRRSALRQDVFLSTDAFATRSLRLHLVHNAGVVSEDLLSLRAFPRRGFVGRPVATLVLEGAALMRVPEQATWLAPGDLALVAQKADVAMRQSRDGEPYRALVLEWDGAVEATRLPAGRLPLTTILPLAARLADRDASTAATWATVQAVVEVFSTLVPTPTLPATPESVSPETSALAAALDEALSELRQSPMASDLLDALPMSPRQLGRKVPELLREYGFNAEGWRDARNRRRILLGAAFLWADTSVAEVAEAVGYGSAEAFTHALTGVGLPAPRHVREELRRLCAAESIRESTRPDAV